MKTIDFSETIASSDLKVIVCSNDDPGVTLTYLTVRYAFLCEKVKKVDFSETIASSDLKVGRCRQLIEFMKVYEY